MKQKIIDTIKSKQEYISGYGYVLPEIQYEIISNELNAKIEQEKKEVAISIYRQLQGHGTTYVKNWIAKEYGVEL